MARLNAAARNQNRTHEGAPAVPALAPIKQLRRSVLACLLWEDTFYEDGISIATRIEEAAQRVTIDELIQVAIEARSQYNLRHVPLLLLRALIKRGRGQGSTADTIAKVIQRPDELAELLAIYWADKSNKHMIPAQLRKGLRAAVAKFNEYSLAKYDQDGAIKLRDVMRLARPKPDSEEKSALYKRIVKRELTTPDTWEVALSGGADKKETFTRLLSEGKLGYFALLRNLRNMEQAGVDEKLVADAIQARKNGAERILPFRYVAAARAAPRYEPALDNALQAAIGEQPKLPGKTAILVDVSGSMDMQLSGKSDMTRIDAAAALAAVVNADELRVFTFSDRVVEVPPRRGMAGVDAVKNSQLHHGTYLGQAVTQMNTLGVDRLIVVSDEQSHDAVPQPTAKFAFMINVASYANGVGYSGNWVHCDGFSEQILRFIREYETNEAA